MQDLYGKKILKFSLSFSQRGITSQFIPVTVDLPKSNVAPAKGCDIIIHGESTHTTRVLPINPDCVKQLTKTHALNGDFEGKMFGYCFESDKDTVVQQFKEALVKPTEEFCRKQQNQINQLIAELSLSSIENN